MKIATYTKSMTIALVFIVASMGLNFSSPESGSFFIKSANAETSQPSTDDASDLGDFSAEEIKYLLKAL